MTNNKDIRKHIKDSLKQDFKLDFVLVQIGFMFEAIEEDATFLCDNFDCQLQGEGKFVSYEITGFPVSGLEKYKQDLDSMNIEYCIVEQKPHRHLKACLIGCLMIEGLVKLKY